MSRTGRLLALAIVLGLGACQPELPPYYYPVPAPPPLQPYMGPTVVAPAPTTVTRRVVKRRYARRRYHRRVRCRCLPVR